MAKVTVDVPGTPKGEPIDVGGLGRFKNGSTAEVTKEQVESWELFSGREWPSSGELALPVVAEAPKSKTSPATDATMSASKVKEVK